MTKKENFNAIKDIMVELNRQDLVNFINHELELLDRKNERKADKLTPKQRENISLKEKIYDSMEDGKAYTATEIKALIPELANENIHINKVSALIKQMRENVLVSREVVKGTAYFTKI